MWHLVRPSAKVQGDAEDMSFERGKLVSHTFAQSPASAAIQGGPHDRFLQAGPPEVERDNFAAKYLLPAVKMYPSLRNTVPASVKV
jgi:hypothetical protein